MLTTKVITSEEDLKTAFVIRNNVFIKEQEVSEENEFDSFDKLDERSVHILVYYKDQAAGTGRVRWVDNVGKLERICVLKSYRSFGLGKVIIKALEQITIDKGFTSAKLHSQTQVEDFYKKLGYTTSSAVFMEAGIPHVLMTKKLNV